MALTVNGTGPNQNRARPSSRDGPNQNRARPKRERAPRFLRLNQPGTTGPNRDPGQTGPNQAVLRAELRSKGGRAEPTRTIQPHGRHISGFQTNQGLVQNHQGLVQNLQDQQGLVQDQQGLVQNHQRHHQNQQNLQNHHHDHHKNHKSPQSHRQNDHQSSHLNHLNHQNLHQDPDQDQAQDQDQDQDQAQEISYAGAKFSEPPAPSVLPPPPTHWVRPEPDLRLNLRADLSGSRDEMSLRLKALLRVRDLH